MSLDTIRMRPFAEAYPSSVLPLYETTAAGKAPDEGFSIEDVNYAKDPVGYHLRAFREFGPIYRIQFQNRMWVAIGGLEANDFAWRNPDLWNYRKAMAGFGEELGHAHVTTLDGPPHRLKRRSLKPGFGADAVTRHLPEMARTVAERFHQMKNREIDLYDFCTQTVLKLLFWPRAEQWWRRNLLMRCFV